MSDTITKGEVIQTKEIAKSNAMYNSELQAQRTMALAKPRNAKTVMEEALWELEVFPDFAQKAYYVIPFKDGEGGIKNVEGPSVKAARALMRIWQNCGCAGRIVAETDDRFEIEAAMIDFETNTVFRKTLSVSKYYVPKATKIKTILREDRLTMAIQAGLAKAERNAILAGLPIGLIETYHAKAKEIAAGVKSKTSKVSEKPIAERYAAMYKAFGELGVEKKTVEDYIARVMKGKGDVEILASMLGIHNAIKEGQITKEQVFESPIETKESDGAIKLDDILPGIGD